jgi:hypothetical protein
MNNRFLLRELITELRRARLQRARLVGMLAPTSGLGALGLMGRRRLRQRLAFRQEVIKGLLNDLNAFDRKASNIRREGPTADFDDVAEGEKTGEEVYQEGYEKGHEEAPEAPEEVKTERKARKRASTKSRSTKRTR